MEQVKYYLDGLNPHMATLVEAFPNVGLFQLHDDIQATQKEPPCIAVFKEDRHSDSDVKLFCGFAYDPTINTITYAEVPACHYKPLVSANGMVP